MCSGDRLEAVVLVVRLVLGLVGDLGFAPLRLEEGALYHPCPLEAWRGPCCKEMSRADSSALFSLVVTLLNFSLIGVGALRGPLRPAFRGEMGLVILVGESGPFLRALGRVRDVGLCSDSPWREILRGVYFFVAILPV